MLRRRTAALLTHLLVFGLLDFLEVFLVANEDVNEAADGAPDEAGAETN